MGVKFGMKEGTEASSMPNLTPVGATCHPCGAKKPQNRPLSNLNTGALRCMRYCRVVNCGLVNNTFASDNVNIMHC